MQKVKKKRLKESFKLSILAAGRNVQQVIFSLQYQYIVNQASDGNTLNNQ